ncbi:MAG: peptide/nickel transport system ATP-binding protein [Saprospiraceae bacterium]|jgi:peptide/nickel transport system ATP-binding protein
MLKIINLNISFASKKAVSNVSFELKKGEVLGVVGESGSGKSLCSLAIMNLLPGAGSVDSGEIEFDGVDLLNTQVGIRGKKIGMIFQEPMTSLNPVFTCGEQLVETMIKNDGLSKKKAIQRSLILLEKVKLPEPLLTFDKYPHELSGGQKQRVMIAIAISCQPQLLIADEPTTALDVTVQKEVLDLLVDLKKDTGMAMLFITHDLALVSNIATRVLVMKNGQVVERGKVKDIFEDPQHPYTKALLACRPPLNKRHTKLPTIETYLLTDNPKEDLISNKSRTKHHKELYSKQAILEVENLKVSYEGVRSWLGKVKEKHIAVNGVSFSLFRGESLGLIGESGCGKTTIGRSLVGLLKNEEGTISYLGKRFLEQSKEELAVYKKDIQIIFQDPFASLNPRKTIGGAIQEPMEVYKIGKDTRERQEKVFDLLHKVGLSKNDYNKYPHEFSGGQRQRISIARTLAVEPKIIICDESVSALDVSIQAQVLNLLNDLKKIFGLTYLFISHDLSVVKHFCDRMLVMNKDGKIEEEGEADHVYTNSKSTYTKSLIEAIPK